MVYSSYTSERSMYSSLSISPFKVAQNKRDPHEEDKRSWRQWWNILD
jgi:hypothetical protein